MRVGMLAPPWVPVPPMLYGGTEAVIDDLSRGLTTMGHEVLLFTVEASTCPVARRWHFPRAVEPMGTTTEELAHVLAGYAALADADVIHDHTMIGPLVAAGMDQLPPIVVTNHSCYTRETRLIYQEIAHTADIVAISNSQRDSAAEVPTAAVIHHGIDLNKQPYGDGAGGFLLFIGRMSPDKGVDRAIRIARAAGRQLVVVSKMQSDAELSYYERTVRPLLGGDIDFRGEVTTDAKVTLLGSATALINPISWPEPFGLVMAEALACGTPVLAFPNGAAPEIVDDGKTGFLCADESEMVAAVNRVVSIDRRACRAVAEQRFSMARMAADYARLYERILIDGSARVAPDEAAS